MKKLLANVMLSFLGLASLHAQNEITPEWSYMADATSTDNVTDFWVNPAGDSYILGHITTLPGVPHMDGLMLIKVNPLGQEQWRKYLHATNENWSLMAKGVAGDEAGNIFIVYNEGYRYTDYTNNRVIVAKYNSQGSILWTQDLTENLQGRLENINAREVLYKEGHLYLPGNYTANLFADSDADGLIYKISTTDGSVAEKIIYDSDYSSDDFFREVRVDGSGNMIVIGRSRGLNGPGGIYSDYDSLIVKYDADGTRLWESSLNGEGNSEDHGINIAVDTEGNSYTSSQLKQIGISQRLVVVRKHSPSGEVLWTYQYQGSSSGYNHKQPVEILSNGNVVLVTSNENGINTIVLNGTTGTQVWATNYNRSAAGAANRQSDLLIDSQDNIYITGVSRDNTPFGAGHDMVTISYGSTGQMNWISNFNNGNYETMGDNGVVLRQDGSGNIYAIGWTQHADNNDDFLILKYGDAVMGTLDAEFAELKVYPNPAADYIILAAPDGQLIDSITLYDMNGRIIKNWNNYEINSRLNISDINAGMYLITVNSGSATASYKILRM